MFNLLSINKITNSFHDIEEKGLFANVSFWFAVGRSRFGELEYLIDYYNLFFELININLGVFDNWNESLERLFETCFEELLYHSLTLTTYHADFVEYGPNLFLRGFGFEFST